MVKKKKEKLHRFILRHAEISTDTERERNRPKSKREKKLFGEVSVNVIYKIFFSTSAVVQQNMNWMCFESRFRDQVLFHGRSIFFSVLLSWPWILTQYFSLCTKSYHGGRPTRQISCMRSVCCLFSCTEEANTTLCNVILKYLCSFSHILHNCLVFKRIERSSKFTYYDIKNTCDDFVCVVRVTILILL